LAYTITFPLKCIPWTWNSSIAILWDRIDLSIAGAIMIARRRETKPSNQLLRALTEVLTRIDMMSGWRKREESKGHSKETFIGP